MCCRRVIKKVFTLTTRGATMKKLACSLLTIIILFTISCEIGLGSSVDTEPPSLSIAADIADKVIRDDFVLRGTYSDDGTVSKLSAVLKRTDKNGEPLEYDGVIIENLKKRGSGTWTIDIPAKSKSVKDGTYQADVSITDSLGRTTVQSTIFTIDNTPPIIILTRPSTALESTSSDTYGQKFTIEGAAAEKNDIGRMEIQLYTDEACTIPAAEEPIVLTNVPSSIEVEAANYDVEQAKYIYKGITQSFFIDVPTDGEGREFYYKLFAYDGAKRYLPEDETPSDDDLKGNRAEYFFLQKDIYENIQQYYTITEMYSILSDNYFESSTDRAADAPLPEQVRNDLLDDSKYQRTIGKFNLNPKNNPTYTVTGRSPLASLTKSSFENDDNALIIGGQLIIEVSPGLDGHILKEDTIKIYTRQYTFTDGTPVVGTPVEITQYERKESGNTYKYITNINREDGYEIGKFYTVYVEGKDVKNNTIVSAGNNPYGFRLISNGRAPVINLSEPEDVTTYTNKKQIFKGTAEVELGIPVVNVYKGIVSESTKVKTIEFTEEQGHKEGSDFVFDFTYEDETFDGKTGKSKFLFETDLGGQKSTQPQERTVIYDMDLPTISITKPTTAKKFKTDGSEEAGAYLNGEVEFTVMLNDKGGSGLDSETNKPKWEIFDASNKTTPLASGFITETTGETISINTAEPKYNGKTIIFRVTAWDVAGNKKSTEADDSKYTFIVDQTTDIPFICEDTDYGKVKFSLNSVDAYMAQSAEAKFGTVKKSSTLKFKVYEDDGSANITILKKKLNITKNNDGTYTSDWTNDLSAFDEEEAFEEEIDTPNKLVTMNTYSFPSTDAECGYYEYVIIATDKSDKSASPRNTIKGPFIVRITKDEASITVEKDFDYRNENSEFTNTITIIPSEGPYKLYRQVVVDGEQYNDTFFGDTDIAEYKLIKDNIPDTTLIHEDKLKLSTYAHDKNITVYYKVIDGASQASASQSVVLKYDNAAFAPEIKAPIAGKTGKQALTETTQISARLRDDRAGVEKVFYKFTHNSNPGTEMGTAGGYESEPASNGSFALDLDFVEGFTAGTNQLCEGKWFFHIYTEDGAGNVSAVETREFDIDMKSPVITTTLDDTAISTDAVHNKNAAYTFKFKITETNALDASEPVTISVKKGTTPISYTIKDGTTEVSDLTQIVAEKDYAIEIPDADGLYTYTITVKDFVGKDAKVERVVQYDTTPPVAKHEIDTKQKDLYFRIGDYSNDTGVPDVGGKYSGGTYGNALTIQIRGYFDDEGSGINKFYYKTFNNLEVKIDSAKATGSEPVEENETIYFNSPDVLKNYVIEKNTGTFFPLDEPEEKNVDYNTAAGKATKAIVSNYKTTIKGFQEGKNYLVLVAEDNVGNTAVDYAEIEGVGKFYCYSLNVDITSPSIPTKEDENLFTNIDSTNTDSNVHFYIEGTVSDKPNMPNGSAGLASVVFTRDGGTGSIELKASDLTEPTTEDIAAVSDDSTLKHWKVDVKSLLPSSGTAIISAKVTDNAGYEVSVPVANITVDRTAPEVIINSPVADAKIGATNLIINGTASDGNGAGISSDKLKVYYTKSESLGTATAAPASTDFGTAIAEKWVELGEVTSGAIWTYTKPDINATETIASNNENTSLYFMVSAKDNSGTGNVGYSSPRKVTVDRKAPVFVSGKFNGNETTSTDAWINNRTVNLEGSFTDTHAGVEGSGVTSIFYKFYETGDETSLANAVEKVIPTTDGSYNTNVNLDDSISNASFEIWAKDSAGNVSAKKTYLIKVDYTAPNLSASYYKKGTDSVTATGSTVYIKNQDGGTSFVLYGNYNDGTNQSGVKALVFKKNGTAFTPTVTYSATAISATAIENGTIPDDSTYADYNNTAAAGYNSWKTTFSLNETARITVEGEDNAGNKATAVSAIDVTFDNTNPVLSNLNFTETKDGVTKDVYSKDDQYYTNHTVSGKTFKISGITTDNVGVESVSLTVTNNATTPVSITPTMEGTTNNWSFTPDMSSWTTGVTGATAKVTVKDKAGNTAEKTLTIVFDTTAPTVDASKFVTPTKEQTESTLFKFEGQENCISHSATVSGLDKVELLFTTTSGIPEATATPNATASIADNGSWSSTIEFSKVTAFSTQGEKWLWVRAYDKAGNVSAWTPSESFVYDKSVPTIQFTGTTNPAAGSYKKAGFTLTVKAEDTYGIQAFDVIYPISLSTQPAGWPTHYYTDASGTSAASTFAAGTYYFKQTETVTAAESVDYSKVYRVGTETTANATLLPDGNDTITIIAKDKAGKTATISRTIHVDTVAPNLNALILQNIGYSSIDDTWFRDTTLSLVGSYKDENGSGVKTIHYELNDEESTVTPIYDEQENAYNYSTNISGFAIGLENTLKIWAEDNANNLSSPEQYSIRIDNVTPVITATQTDTINTKSSKPVTITGIVEDNDSGINYESFAITIDNHSTYNIGGVDKPVATNIALTEVTNSNTKKYNWTATIPAEILSVVGKSSFSVMATVKDNAGTGNPKTDVIANIAIDDTVPTLKFDSTSGYYKDSTIYIMNSITATVSAADKNGIAGLSDQLTTPVVYYNVMKKGTSDTNYSQVWDSNKHIEIDSDTGIGTISISSTDGVSFVDGTKYKLVISTKDTVGNESTTEKEFTADLTKPTQTELKVENSSAEELNSTNNKPWFSKNTLKLTGRYTDSASGVQTVYYKRWLSTGTEPTTAVEISPTFVNEEGGYYKYETNIGGFERGTNKLKVWAKDNVGNEVTPVTYDVQLDEDPPEILEKNANDFDTEYMTNGVTPKQFEFNVKEVHSGISTDAFIVKVGSGTSPLTLGSGDLWTDTDETNLLALKAKGTLTTEEQTTKNALEAKSALNLVKVGQKTGDNYPVTVQIGTSAVSELNGNKPVTVTVQDVAGNKSSTTPVGSLNVDTTKPVVKFSKPSANAKLNKNYKVSGSITEKNEIKSITLTATTGTGSSAKTNTYSYKKTPAQGETNTITLNEDKSWEITVNTNTEEWNNSTTSEDWTLTVSVVDEAGNVSDSTTDSTRSVKVDQNSDRPIIKVSQIDSTGNGFVTVKTLFGTIDDDDKTDNATVNKLWLWSKQGAGLAPSTAPSLSGSTWSVPEGWMEFGGNTKSTLDNNSWQLDSDEYDGDTTWFWAVADTNNNVFWTKAENQLNRPYIIYKGGTELSDNTNGISFKYDTKAPEITKIELMRLATNTYKPGTTRYSASEISGYITDYNDGKQEKDKLKWVTEDNYVFGADYALMYMKVSVKEETGMATYDASEQIYPLTISGIIEKAAENTSKIEVGESSFSDSFDSATNVYTYLVGPIDFTTYPMDKASETYPKVNITITARDGAGKTSLKDKAVYVDNEANITVTKVSPDTTKETSGEFEFRVNLKDRESDVKNIQYYIPLSTENNEASVSALASDKWNDVTELTLDGCVIEFTDFNSIMDYSIDTTTNQPKVKTGFEAYEIKSNNEGQGIYNVPVWFKVTDEVGNIGYANQYVTKDASGNVSAPKDIVVKYNPNTDRPKVYITDPVISANPVEKGGKIKISGTAEDNEGIAAVYLQFDMGTGTFAEGSETVPTTTIKATKANNTKNWNCTLDVGSIANDKIVRVRAIAVDTDTSTGQLVSAWSDVLSIKVNNTVPSFENMYLRQYDTDGTTVKVEKEYQLGMFVKGEWILEGTVSTVKSDNLKQLSIGGKDWVRSGSGTGSWGSSGPYDGATVSFVPDTSDKTIRFSIPVSGTSGEWSVGIVAYDNANNPNTETPAIYIDEKAPEFADYVGEKTDEVIKLYQDSYGGSGRELGDANFLKNSNGSKFTLAGKVKEPEGESGFEKAVFYFERFTGSGSSKSNPRVYNVMESRGQNNNANKTLVAASKAAINETNPIYINSDKLPVRPLTVTRPSSGELSAEVIKTDLNIRNYGLVYVGGLYRTITSINRTTGVVTIDPADETNATEAEFVYGMVVDHNGEGENSDGSVRNDDGDGMLESWSGSQSAGYRWEATFNSANIPDGPIEIHVVVFDQAGNIGHGYMTTRASNNAPRITKVMLGTDLNGNGVFDYGSGEFNTFYAQKDDNQNPITKTGLANWNLITNEHLGNSKSWKVKNGIAVIPEFVGGAPDFYYQFSKAATSLDEPEQIASANLNSHKLLGSGANDKIKLSGTETKATWDYSTNKVDGVDVTNYGGSLTLTTEQINAATGSVTEDTEGYYRFTFWDSTEESTPGTDTGSTILNIQLIQDLTDDIAPTAEIEPFKWEGTGYTRQVSTSVNGGAATTTAAVLDTLERGQDQYYVLGTETVTTSTTDENGNVSTTVTTTTVTPKNSLYGASKANGHIELQEDIKNITAITSTLGADDPKVSGKITFHGTAFDETRLSSIWFKFDDFTPTNTLADGDSSKTPATGYSQAAYYNKASANWTLASATIADGWEISVTDKEFSQDGHTVDWYLSIDTSKISSVVGKDKAFTIVALDAAGKKSTIYASGSEDQTKVNDNGTLHKTPYYKVDVVPYITGISTELSEGNKKRPTVLSRSALGVYPVRRGSSISIEGFNLTGATTGVSIAGTAIDEEDRSATETGGVSVPVGAGISSGVVEVSVNSVSSLNNKTAKSITTGTGNTATTRNVEYNTEPNGQNNDKLTDKRELKILDVTTTTDITDKRMLDMAVYGTNLNFSAGYGPDNYGIIMKEGTNQRSVSKVRNSFTRYFDGALAINSEGTPFTISACGDSYTAVSAWGDGPSHLALTRGTTTASSYQEYQGANGTSLLYLESNWNGANFNNLDRFKLPDMVVTGNNADTKGYISYYDSTQKIIKFRYFVTNGTKVATNYTALTGGSAPGSAGDDYSIISKESTEGTVNNYKDSTSNQVYTQGYIAISGANANSQYSAVGVTGTTALVSWYDATNGALKMKYNPSPATSFSGYQVFSDYPSQGTITFDIKVDNGNTRSVEVPYTYVTGNNRTNTRNIHELAYQMNLVLSNGYGAYAEVDPRWNKLVVRSMQTGSSSSIEITNLNSTGNSNGSVYTGNTTFTANNTTFRGKLNGCGNAWQEVTIDDDSAGQYVVMKTDSKGGIHFAYYDTGNGDLKYAYMSSVTATPVVVTVDGYQQVGQYVDLALKENADGSQVTPYISYYSMSNADTKRSAKVAKLASPITYNGATANASSVKDGSVDELFTGAWEVFHVPTAGIPVQYRVNIGVTSAGNVYISYLADRIIEYVKVE